MWNYGFSGQLLWKSFLWKLVIKYGQLQILYGKTIRCPLVAYLRITTESITPVFNGPYKKDNLGPELHVEHHQPAFQGDCWKDGRVFHKGHLQRAQILRCDGWIQYGHLEGIGKVCNIFVGEHDITESFAGGSMLQIRASADDFVWSQSFL